MNHRFAPPIAVPPAPETVKLVEQAFMNWGETSLCLTWGDVDPVEIEIPWGTEAMCSERLAAALEYYCQLC